jgi:hypothetical protein
MSRNRKYTKFGLRADRNLSDLSDSDQGISNVLNDISVNLNEFGQKTGFSLADIEPLRGLRNTGALANNVVNDDLETRGQSIDLKNLADSKVQFLVSTGTKLTKRPGLLLSIEPMVIMQDYIDNSKSILGDPPWLNGGDGPVCEFVSSDRINSQTITDAITGDSGTAAAEALSSTQIFSTSSTYNTKIVKGVDFWDNANFEFGDKLHPKLPDQFGLIQWIGYITENTTQYWESTGLFMIEQETTIPDKYNKLKCVFTDSRTIGDLTWTGADLNRTFTVRPFNKVAKKKISEYVCRFMKVTQGTTLIGTVYSVNNNLGTCEVTADAEGIAAQTDGTGAGATGLKFSFDIGDEQVITSDSVTPIPVKLGDRSKVRYTLWFPPLGVDETYGNKLFKESPGTSTINLPYNIFYSTEEKPAAPTYSHKYFHENSGSAVSQRIESGKTLRINSSIHINYAPKDRLTKVLATPAADEVDGKHVLTTKQILIKDNTGRLYCEAGWSECSVGDWVAFKINSPTANYHISYQIEEIYGLYAFVDPTINDQPLLKVVYDGSNDVASAPAPIIAVVFKNTGLVGIFSNDRTLTLTETELDADKLRVGKRYRIKTVGTPLFTSVGAANDNLNTIFIATGTNGGNGTVVLEADSTATGLFEVSQSKADSLVIIDADAIVEGTSYKIITLGDTTPTEWHAAAGTQSSDSAAALYHADYKADDTFKAVAAGTTAGTTAGTVRASIALPPIDLINRDQTFFTVLLGDDGATVNAGSFDFSADGPDYEITSIGDTTPEEWNAAAGTTDVTYVVGHRFKAAAAGTTAGTTAGTVKIKPIVGIARPEKLNNYVAFSTKLANNATVGESYRIISLGLLASQQSDWHTAAGTQSSDSAAANYHPDYVVGDVITIATQLTSATTYPGASSRTMTLVGNKIDKRDITSQNYYENPTASNVVYDGSSHICLTAVYGSTGLENQNLSSKCAGVKRRTVLAFSEANFTNVQYNTTAIAAVIKLDSVEGINLQDTIHHPLFAGDNVKAGKIDGIDVALSTIYVKAGAMSQYAAADLPVGATIAVVPAAVDVADIASGGAAGLLYECVIPLDTAPPFRGTTAGLATPTGNDLEVYNKELSFSELNLVVDAGALVETSSDIANISTDSHFKIKYGSDTALTVSVIGTSGAFTCTSADIYVGDYVTISGTLGGTGSITGYANPTTYKISAVTGGSAGARTGFTLTTTVGGALTTDAGTPTGVTYTKNADTYDMLIKT